MVSGFPVLSLATSVFALYIVHPVKLQSRASQVQIPDGTWYQQRQVCNLSEPSAPSLKYGGGELILNLIDL